MLGEPDELLVMSFHLRQLYSYCFPWLANSISSAWPFDVNFWINRLLESSWRQCDPAISALQCPNQLKSVFRESMFQTRWCSVSESGMQNNSDVNNNNLGCRAWQLENSKPMRSASDLCQKRGLIQLLYEFVNASLAFWWHKKSNNKAICCQAAVSFLCLASGQAWNMELWRHCALLKSIFENFPLFNY